MVVNNEYPISEVLDIEKVYHTNAIHVLGS
jgi:hypothetical protein